MQLSARTREVFRCVVDAFFLFHFSSISCFSNHSVFVHYWLAWGESLRKNLHPFLRGQRPSVLQICRLATTLKGLPQIRVRRWLNKWWEVESWPVLLPERRERERDQKSNFVSLWIMEDPETQPQESPPHAIMINFSLKQSAKTEQIITRRLKSSPLSKGVTVRSCLNI